MTNSNDPTAEIAAWAGMAEQLKGMTSDALQHDQVITALRTELEAMTMAKKSFEEQIAAETDWLESLSQTCLPEFLQDLSASIEDFAAQSADALQDFHERTVAQAQATLDAINDRHDEFRDEINVEAEKLINAIVASVDRFTNICGDRKLKMQEACTPAQTAIKAMGHSIETLEKDVSRVLDAVATARQHASAGMSGAAGALQSVKSVMDDIV